MSGMMRNIGILSLLAAMQNSTPNVRLAEAPRPPELERRADRRAKVKAARKAAKKNRK